jgi:uncharacterized lipoprotein YmbA
MKPAKRTKKASAAKAPKTNLQVNLEYVEQIADEAIATVMVLRALVRQLAEKLEEQK